MRSEIITQLDSDIDYWLYLRENPNWHKILSFHPERFKDFLEEYKNKRKKRMIDKIDDINSLITIIETFLKK